MNQNIVTLEPSNSLLHDYSIIRDKNTKCAEFCFYANKIITRLVMRAMDWIDYEKVVLESAVGLKFNGIYTLNSLHYNSNSCYTASGLKIATGSQQLCAVSIMRAGDSMVDVARQLHPGLSIGKILIQRDEETALPNLIYSKLCPDISNRTVLLLDPMLATGGSAIKAVEVLLENKVKQNKIIFVNLISCPEGLQAFQKAFPEVRVLYLTR